MEWIYRELSGVLLSEKIKVSDEDIVNINSLPNPPLIPLTAREISSIETP